MGSVSKNMFHEPKTPPKLSLLAISRATVPPPELPTPPPSRTAVSVPFQWEVAPGKPRLCHTRSELKPRADVARTLELPPRLVLSESPTTVLDGPYVGRAVSFTSPFRSCSKDTWSSGNDNFASNRWKKSDDPEAVEGSLDFSSWTAEGTRKVKITRVRRKGSFSSGLSHGGSHLLASIYESFKQVVPWKRRQEKQRKRAPKFDTV